MIRLWAFIAILITIIHGPYHNFEHWARYKIVTGPIISHVGMGAPEFILVSAAPHWTLLTVSQDSWHLSEAGGQVSSSGWQPASGRSRWSLTWLCVTGPSVDLYQHPEYQGKTISHNNNYLDFYLEVKGCKEMFCGFLIRLEINTGYAQVISATDEARTVSRRIVLT